MDAARTMLGTGGSVLDVGCGGGRSSLPLQPLLTSVVGVDEQQAMLDQFEQAAAQRGIRCTSVQGNWPTVASQCPTVDVVVCHHVAYNVGPIDPFIRALTDRAKVGVVVELPDRHPTSPLNSLWMHFWDVQRPVEPSAELFVAAVAATGVVPAVQWWDRPRRAAPSAMDRPALVAFVRQRLCLSADRDPEIDEVLGPDPKLSSDRIATVSWRCS
jgi:SAM-dependent methyltransferase